MNQKALKTFLFFFCTYHKEGRIFSLGKRENYNVLRKALERYEANLE